MLRFGGKTCRLTLLALLVAVTAGRWLRYDTAVWTPAAAAHTLTIDTESLIGSLPAQLARQVEPGLHLVALVSADIDADGDLDVIASDGSLDLLVWINDGAGHLTRRYAQRPRGWSGVDSSAESDGTRPAISAVVSTTTSIGPAGTWTLALSRRGNARPGHAPTLASFRALSRSLRAPPSSVLL